MDSATLISRARSRAGLSQRELADRAGTSAAAICLYESGERVPRVDTLQRVVAATGSTLVINVVDPAPIDVERNANILLQVLELSEHFPYRFRDELSGPVFAELAE